MLRASITITAIVIIGTIIFFHYANPFIDITSNSDVKELPIITVVDSNYTKIVTPVKVIPIEPVKEIVKVIPLTPMQLKRQEMNYTDFKKDRLEYYDYIYDKWLVNNTSIINADHGIACEQSLDNTPPVTTTKVYGVSGYNGWYNDQVTVQFNAVDECSGVKRVLVDHNKQFWELRNYQSLNFKQIFDNADPKGTLDIYYQAVDYNGNIENKTKVRVMIDNLSPRLAFLNVPDKLELDHEQEFTINIYSSDFDSGIEKIMLKPCKTSNTECNFITFNGTRSDVNHYENSMYVNYTQLFKHGTYVLDMIAYDYAGNSTTKLMLINVR